MQHTSLLLLASFAVALFSACGPTVVYEHEHPFPGQWTYADSVSFSYLIEDIDEAYDLVLTVEHTDIYPTQNLYTKFVTIYPNGLRAEEPVSIELADKFGQWLGYCSGEECELRVPLQQGAKFPEAGSYGLTIYQYGRQDSLQALRGLGLAVYVADGTAE